MDHFAGLDVSVKETSLCIMDDTGRLAREVKIASEPEVLLAVLTNPAYLSFPKIISGRIGGAVQPGSEWRQWRQIVGRLDARAHLSVMPGVCALDCNTPHRRKELAAGAPRRR